MATYTKVQLTGSGVGSGWQNAASQAASIRDYLTRNGFGVNWVDVRRATDLSNLINVRLELNADCSHSDAVLVSAISQVLSRGGLLNRPSFRVSGRSAGCGPREAAGGGYVHNAGNLATVTVTADDDNGPVRSSGNVTGWWQNSGTTPAGDDWATWASQNSWWLALLAVGVVLIAKR